MPFIWDDILWWIAKSLFLRHYNKIHQSAKFDRMEYGEMRMPEKNKLILYLMSGIYLRAIMKLLFLPHLFFWVYSVAIYEAYSSSYWFYEKNKITRFTGKCIEVGSTLLSEVNQTHASKHCMFFLKCGSYPRIYVLYVCKQRVSMTNYRYSVRLRSREQGRVTLGNQEGWNVGKGTHESWKNTGLVFLPSSFNLAIFFFSSFFCGG